jgi:L-fucose isomerase-like protein
MLKTRIGFIPSNWDAWNGKNWAEKMRDRCVSVLEEIPGIDLIVPSKEMTKLGCVSSVEDAKIALDHFKKQDVQALLIGNMTFGMEVAVSTVLNGMPKDMPILHFCTRSGPIDKDGSRSTDNWCGHFMTAAAIKRRGFNSVHIRTCNPEEEYFKEKIEIFTRAVLAVSKFKGLKIGQLGARPQLFESENWNEQAMQKNFRQMVVPMDFDTVLTTIEKIDPEDKEVLKIMKEIAEGVIIEEETDETLLNLARCEVGFKKIAKELDVDALAIRCWTRIQERLHVSPCFIMSRLTDNGLVCACEVDIYGAASMFAAYSAALGIEKPHFIDWTDLHPDKPDVWLAWHCGNAPISNCDLKSRAKLYRNERMIQWCETCHGAIEFRLKEGPVTCLRLVEYDGEFTMFFGNGEIIDIDPFIRGTYGWVKVNDVFDWEKKMIESGIIHHGVLIHDPKVADAMEMFCKFLDIKAVRGA